MVFVKMIGIAVIIILLLLAAGLILYFKLAPQFGGKPAGVRLERMHETDNFRNGRFYNTVSTRMDMQSGKMLQVMWEFIRGSKDREPEKTITVKKFNSSALSDPGNPEIAFIWFGHSTLLLKIDGKKLLIDPMFSERASMFPFLGPRRFEYSEDTGVESLPELDAVLISHDHYDHLDYKTIINLKDKAKRFYVPLSVGAHLERWNIPKEKITELSWWQETVFDSLILAFTPTRHFSGRGLTDRFSTLWGSWVIIGKESKVFFGADSGYFPGFVEIGEKYGPFDITFLECGAYNENWSDIHMMPEESVQAHIDLKGKFYMPIHWGKFNLALHPWKEPVERAMKSAISRGVKMITPEIGKTITLGEQNDNNAWWRNY